MAYMSQEKKKIIASGLKKVLKQYKIKGTLSVDNHSTLVLKVKEGPINFHKSFTQPYINHLIKADEEIDVNVYHYRDHFTGKAREFLVAAITIMNVGNHDNSDIQSDYVDVGWYVDVKIGTWNKPYVMVK